MVKKQKQKNPLLRLNHMNNRVSSTDGWGVGSTGQSWHKLALGADPAGPWGHVKDSQLCCRTMEVLEESGWWRRPCQKGAAVTQERNQEAQTRSRTSEGMKETGLSHPWQWPRLTTEAKSQSQQISTNWEHSKFVLISAIRENKTKPKLYKPNLS